MVAYLIITGMSGAGRSSAADSLDDLGWFVIDNLPLPLFAKITELTVGLGEPFEKIAFVLGAGSARGEVQRAVEQLRATGQRVQVVFLDASDEVLVRRFEETRRRHPIRSSESLLESIASEREVLEVVKADADVVVDTTDLNIHGLRARMLDLFGEEHDGDLQLQVSSFGYKRGIPLDADYVFDCRFLPNPHWVDDLRPLSGLDPQVAAYVLGQEVATSFLDDLTALFGAILPAYRQEGKAYLSIAFGCTGGRHRSVVMAEAFAARLTAQGCPAPAVHRDVDK